MNDALPPFVFDSRWEGAHGIGRFAREVRARLPEAHDLRGNVRPSSAADPAYLSLRLAAHPGMDLFYSPGYNAPLVSRRPFIFTIHDLNHIDVPESESPLKRAYYKHVMKPACRRARAVLTVSEFSRRRICEWSGIDPSHVVNVGNGVSDNFSTSGSVHRPFRPYVLCAGNRRPHKNEGRTLHAFASIAARIPHDLVFLGTESVRLVQQIREAGMEQRVRFTGSVTDEGLANLYRGASVVVFASLYEGFGMPVVEAMACGVPVITSRVTAMPEVAGNAAVLVDPLCEQQIGAAIERTVEDSDQRKRLIDAGIANARRFSWASTAARVRDAIRRCSG